MKVQMAICAKDLPTEASYKAVVVTAADNARIGVTEASTATTHPVWNHLVTPSTDLPDDTEVVVQIVKANKEDDIVATAKFNLQAITGSYYQAAASFSAEEGDGGAKIAMYAAPPTMGKLTLQLLATDLPDTDFGMFRKQHTDGMYEIYSAVTGKQLVRSNCVEDDLNPVWDEMELDLDVLCGGRLDAPIRITVLDKDGGGETQYLGQVMMTVNQMLGQGDGVLKHYPLIKGGAKSAQGSISVKKAVLQPSALASRKAHKHLQLVLTALDAKRDALMEEVAAKQATAAQAKENAATAEAAVKALEDSVQAAAKAQNQVQSQLATLKQQHAALQATAAATPCTGRVELHLVAKDLPDTDFGLRNKTDPIFEIFAAGNKEKVVRSNIVEDDLNPVWQPVTVDLAQLGGSLDAKFKIVVSDKDGGSNQTAIGSVETTVNKLVAAAGGKSAMDLPPSKKGQLFVNQAVVHDLVNHAQVAQDFYTTKIEPVAKTCATATQTFEAARAQMDTARAAAATAAEAAQTAQDAAEAAQLALEMMEKSG